MSAIQATGPKPRMIVPQRVQGALVSLAALVVGAGIWELIGRNTQRASFAPFSATIQALWGMTRDGTLPHALSSRWRCSGSGSGFASRSASSRPAARALRGLRIALEPYVSTLYAMPRSRSFPFILALFGFLSSAKVIVVMLFGIWPILINTLEGARTSTPTARSREVVPLERAAALAARDHAVHAPVHDDRRPAVIARSSSA